MKRIYRKWANRGNTNLDEMAVMKIIPHESRHNTLTKIQECFQISETTKGGNTDNTMPISALNVISCSHVARIRNG
jgi:hypothetical protein